MNVAEIRALAQAQQLRLHQGWWVIASMQSHARLRRTWQHSGRRRGARAASDPRRSRKHRRR